MLPDIIQHRGGVQSARIVFINMEPAVWRGWKVIRKPNGFLLMHLSFGIERTFRRLADVRLGLPTYDAEVVKGQIPEGFSKTKERMQREKANKPPNVKLQEMNTFAFSRLKHIEDKYQKSRAEWDRCVRIGVGVDALTDRNLWDYLILTFEYREIKPLLELYEKYPDSTEPKDLLKQICSSLHKELVKSRYHTSVSHTARLLREAKWEATTVLYELLEALLGQYQNEEL